MTEKRYFSRPLRLKLLVSIHTYCDTFLWMKDERNVLSLACGGGGKFIDGSKISNADLIAFVINNI